MALPVIAVPGSLAAVVGASKAFVLTHPVSIAFTGGAVLSLAATSYFSKRKRAKQLAKIQEA